MINRKSQSFRDRPTRKVFRQTLQNLVENLQNRDEILQNRGENRPIHRRFVQNCVHQIGVQHQ